ncbi:unnamed protein product [Gulo gulo]|uniref:Uncharacterized protein n=1 Tax=Gulo gulo TaxID=48420 RepID=A0A9X9LC04_GULGU|nr:unnamed protein product [Gulo gulo]
MRNNEAPRTRTQGRGGARKLPQHPTLQCCCDRSLCSVHQRVSTLASPVSTGLGEPEVRLSVLLYFESHSPYFVIKVRKAVHGSLPPGAKEQQSQRFWRPRGPEMAQAGFQSPARNTPWPNSVLLSPQHQAPRPPKPREGFQAREGAPSSGAGVKSEVRQVREYPGGSIFDLVQDLDVLVAVEDRWVVKELGIIFIPWSDHLKKNQRPK